MALSGNEWSSVDVDASKCQFIPIPGGAVGCAEAHASQSGDQVNASGTAAAWTINGQPVDISPSGAATEVAVDGSSATVYTKTFAVAIVSDTGIARCVSVTGS